MDQKYRMVLELVVDSMQSPWHITHEVESDHYAQKVAAKIFMVYRQGANDPKWSTQIVRVIEIIKDAMFAKWPDDAKCMELAHKYTRQIAEVFDAELV